MIIIDAVTKTIFLKLLWWMKNLFSITVDMDDSKMYVWRVSPPESKHFFWFKWFFTIISWLAYLLGPLWNMAWRIVRVWLDDASSHEILGKLMGFFSGFHSLLHVVRVVLGLGCSICLGGGGDGLDRSKERILTAEKHKTSVIGEAIFPELWRKLCSSICLG